MAVSVIVLCRDQGDDLIEAVASAERHAPGCEVIVADAGSSQPRTVEVLAALRGAGYQVVGDRADGGGISAAAQNAAIRQARGSYFLPLDATERLQGGFVAAAVRHLEAEPGAGAVYAGHRELGHRATSVEAPEPSVDRLLCGSFIPSCALVRKAAWEASGGYDEELGPDAEWDLWLAMTERGWQLRRVPGLACDRHRRSRDATAPGGAAAASLPEAILRKHQALYLKHLPGLLAALVRAINAGTGGETTESLAASPAAPAADTSSNAPATPAAETPSNVPATLGAAEREGLHREIAAWRDRVAFMENTRAWRLRERLLRLKRWLR